MEQPADWNRERAYLQETLACVDAKMAYIDKRFAEGISAADERSTESVRELLESQYRKLLLVRDKPYFARIDFYATHGREEGIPEECYLGKCTVSDENRRLLVVDWRAPVSTLYYEGRIGSAGYFSPDGPVEGELRRKRQYQLEARELLDYQDIDISSDDELLRPYLSVSADTRLKNIISTIQAEQNAIIRASLDTPLLVQGVAGSGKTTVALHRIAWMVYTFDKRFRPESFMILAPNRFFLQYIGHVLPDLGVENVPQMTVEELLREHTRLRRPLSEEPTQTLESVLSEPDEQGASTVTEAAAFKSSLDCMKALDDFLKGVERNFLPDEPLCVREIPLLSAEALRAMFLEKPALSFRERIERMGNRILLLQGESDSTRLAVRKYLKERVLPKPLTLYRMFLREQDAARGTAWAAMAGDRMTHEDLPALCYLWLRISGVSPAMRQVRHIIIDEAQDCGPFLLALLRGMYPNAGFTLLGDLAQGLFCHRGLTDWERLRDTVYDGRAEILHLRKSYRTTVEIMDYAARLLPPELPGGEAVIRHGEPVCELSAVSDRERGYLIAERMRRHLEAGHRSVAVIAHDRERVKALAKLLRKADAPGFELLDSQSERYDGGVLLLSAAAAKGLEFDAVIVADARAYDGERPVERLLLYVACTRAMHALDIIE